MNWLRYLAEANLYLGVFYLCYVLFLKKETHYLLNRIYLLCISIISFAIPVVQLGILKPAEPIVQNIVLAAPINHQTGIVTTPNPSAVTHFDIQDAMWYAYLLGAVILTILLALKLYQLVKLTRKTGVSARDGYKVISIESSGTAFSFFNLLFIGTSVRRPETVIRHELVHIRQKHSADIILIEVIKIICWFNPLVYLMQNTFKALHEYIADEKAAAYEPDTFAYSSFLVSNIYDSGGSAITHSFFNYNLLKNRINMLHQKRSGSLARLKYLVIIPICAGLLCLSTLGFSKNYGWVDLAPRHEASAITTPATDTPKTRRISKADYKNKSVTSKGYKYKETGYLVNNKANFRVTITDEQGREHDYYKNSATPEQIALLKNKYGYTFPTMEIFSKMPPPPPEPPAPGHANVRRDTLVKPRKPMKLKQLPPPVVKPPDTLGPEKPAAPVKPTPPPPPKLEKTGRVKPVPPIKPSDDTNTTVVTAPGDEGKPAAFSEPGKSYQHDSLAGLFKPDPLTSREVAEVLIKQSIVKNKDHFSFTITNADLMVDGVKQSEELHSQILKKYNTKPGDKIDLTYSFHY